MIQSDVRPFFFGNLGKKKRQLDDQKNEKRRFIPVVRVVFSMRNSNFYGKFVAGLEFDQFVPQNAPDIHHVFGLVPSFFCCFFFSYNNLLVEEI